MPALDGMRVLDMTQYEAGTSCTQALAWLGADVVKVESPEGDPGRQIFGGGPVDSQYFLNYNSNKRSIVLDVTKPEGRDLLLRLVPRFNVFVENFGPGVIEKLNIGYDVMRALNPGLIYTRIKGFGLSGPYANYRVFDPLAQAAAGSVSTTGDASGPPGQPGPSLSDSGTGMQAALAITAAYVQFLNTGAGQQIELSMQEATLSFMKTRLVSGWDSDKPVPRRASLGSAPSGMFPCAPGGPNDYVYFSIVTSRMWDTLCVAMGRPALASDERFATAEARAKNVAALREEISAWTMQHTKHEAMSLIAGAGVPASAVFDSVDVFNDPHLHERGFFQKVQHPTNGTVTLMSSPLRMSGSQTALRRAPLKGEHSRAVLRDELGLPESELRVLDEKGVIPVERVAADAR
jgi:crotonobetainyl-CoA:carnitine CoA-transferase CaiB-like acyl-CoA transferase